MKSIEAKAGSCVHATGRLYMTTNYSGSLSDMK